MKLPDRLQAVATLVDMNKRVIDVGCDHAYLSICLTLNNGNKVIATDINKNALANAKKNIKRFNLSKKIETKLTDGLTDIDVKSEDNIVICGMGTNTILNILNTNKLSNTLIISSNNDIPLLREEVIKLGYYIDTELFIIDNKKGYIIIKFLKGYKKYSKNDIFYGPILRKNKIYKKYIKNTYKYTLKNIPRSKVLLRLKYRLKIKKLAII